ncbi:MAG TPA: hypothetical protein VMU17_07995 [Elusimicrobiota bacterium]|nr:hypothetical protein [Elusimicrobiota bacterium]
MKILNRAPLALFRPPMHPFRRAGRNIPGRKTRKAVHSPATREPAMNWVLSPFWAWRLALR